MQSPSGLAAKKAAAAQWQAVDSDNDEGEGEEEGEGGEGEEEGEEERKRREYRERLEKMVESRIQLYEPSPASPTAKKDPEAVKKEVLQWLDAAADNDDIEGAHMTADHALCHLLEALGHEDVVEAYHAVSKWYA